jgi:hypothetical protein
VPEDERRNEAPKADQPARCRLRMTLRPGTVTVTPNSPEAAPTESPPPEENHEDID